MPKYLSTRSLSLQAESHEAIIRGLAPDGGLFTPDSIPQFLTRENLAEKSYQETAALVLRHFLSDYSRKDIEDCVTAAYGGTLFDTPEIAPLRKISGCSLLELWHGPTAAFKDLALTVLPHLMTAACRMEGESGTVSILTATSGDTGKAALSGFADVPGTAVTVLYPSDGVSAVQKMQMASAEGRNVSVIAVEGNFDDCQRLIKQASSDPHLLDGLSGITVSSANSINAGRLIPQIIYYCTAYSTLCRRKEITWGEPVNFAVPTGNFGDILAGWLAKKAGLPVGKLICASNSNHVLTDFLTTGTYRADRPFLHTISPSMDILISSNLERLLFMASGYRADLTAGWMQDLAEKKEFSVDCALLQTIRRDFDGIWTDEEDCRACIRDLWQNEHVLIDPHTAVALSGLKRWRKEHHDNTPAVVLSTASAYKFAHSVLEAITQKEAEDGISAMDRLSELTGVPVPSCLASLKNRKIRFTECIRREDGILRIRKRMEEIAHGSY